jgi:DegV family protein with EDD domain
MKKIAIVLDSFSGLYENDIKDNKDIFFLSLQVEVDNKVIQEGLEVPSQDLIDKIVNGANCATSLPVLSYIQDLINKLLKEYEQVVFLPIPKTMSGTLDTLLAFTKSYKNVTIIENHFTGNTYLEVAQRAIKMMEDGLGIKDVISFIEETNNKTLGYVIPNDLKPVIDSGRLKGIKKHIITSGNFSIIIKVYNKLSVTGIARSKKSAIKKVFSKIEKFCNENALEEGYSYKILYGYEDTFLKLAKEYMKENLIELALEMKTSLSTFIHTGYGSIYIGVTPKIV